MNKFADALGLHKSATFNATVTIHELTQVPLLNAKFRIKWKFKGAKTSSLAGVETPADDAESGHHHRIGHGLASRWLHPRSALSSSTSVNGISSKGTSEQPRRSPSASGSGSRFDRSSSDDDDLDDISDPPSSPPTRNRALAPLSGSGAVNDPGRTPNPNRTPGASFASPFASNGERNVEALYAGSSLSPEQINERDASGPASARRRGMSEVSLITSPTSPSQSRSRSITGFGPEPRGQTAVVSLRSHIATFNREVTCPVSISLRHGASDSKKYHLQPSPVRLSIRQQNMGEEHKLEEEKLGEVVLDLSQFVPRHGRPTDQAKPRRYLLQGCKSNAVLRVSVKMEWLEGAHDYVAPQLKSGQMSNSSSSGLKALAGLSSSPASRSAISLGKGSQNQGSTTRLSLSNNSVASSTVSPSMSRTNSISSQISSQSATRSTPSPEQQRTRPSQSKKKGWHPPHSALTSAAVPMILGSCGTSHVNDQRTAPEIIDALFNRVASPPVRTDWRDSKPSQGGPLGEPFDYRPAGPSREPSVQTETSANGNSAGGRFRRARKAWSVRSGKNDKGGGTASTAPAATSSTQSAHVQADFDRDDPEIPTAASYAQTEAPAERKRQKERDGFLHDVTHDLGARWKAKRQGSADSTTSAGAHHGMVSSAASHRTPRALSEKPRLSIRTATPLRRNDSTSSSTETEHVKSQPLLGAPIVVPPRTRRPSLPASASSRPVSIRWGDQDGDREVQRRPSHSSLTAALPRSILGLGLTEETAARAAARPQEAQDRPASAISFESLVTPPSPAA